MSLPARLRLLITLAIIATFGSLVTAEFLKWDDWFNIWNNPNLNPPTWAGVAYYWRHPAYGLYIPITYTVWAALAAVGYVREADPTGSHLNPYLFHAANIAVHLAATLAVFQILLKLNYSAIASCIGALLFGLHPVQVEAVAWTAGLKDVLAGALGLAAMLMYLQAARSNRPRVTYWVGTIVLISAMLAKPSALVVPFMAALLDWAIFWRSGKQMLTAAGPWMVLAIGCAVLGHVVQPALGVTPAPLWQRPLIVADSVVFYLGKIIWPASLGVDYGRTPAYLASSGEITWTWAAFLAIAVAWRRLPDHPIRTALLIFVVGIVPTSGIVTFLFQYYSTVADHYLYLPMLGVAMIGAQIVRRLGHRAAPYAAVVLLALATRSALQVRYWRDHLTLFEHAIEVNPNSFMALANAADAYIGRGELDVAERYLQRSIRIKPDFLDGHVNLAIVYAQQGRLDESIEQRLKALEVLQQRPAELRGQLMLDNLNAVVATMADAKQVESARKYQTLAEKLAPNHPAVLENQRRLAAAASTKPS